MWCLIKRQDDSTLTYEAQCSAFWYVASNFDTLKPSDFYTYNKV
jgi:hypothetical protein